MTPETKQKLIAAVDAKAGYPRCCQDTCVVIGKQVKCLCPRPCPYWTSTVATLDCELSEGTVTEGIEEVRKTNPKEASRIEEELKTEATIERRSI